MMTAQEWYAAQPKPYVTSGITLAEDYGRYVEREATLAERRACAEIADECDEQVYGPYGTEFVQSEAAKQIARLIRERE